MPTLPKRAPKIDTRRGAKKKPCSFCQHGVGSVDYKDLAQLRKYISDRGKIRGRKVSGNCQQHQRDVTDSIKTARELALLPYTQRTVTERRGGRGARDDRGPRGPRPDRDAAERTPEVEAVSEDVNDETSSGDAEEAGE
jgi:small subunit ribosomal protein S18